MTPCDREGAHRARRTSRPALGYQRFCYIYTGGRHTRIAWITPHGVSYIQDRRHVDRGSGPWAGVSKRVHHSSRIQSPPPRPCFSCGCGGGGGGAKQD
eukprot:scaffold20031_cov65-Phaeocystis_antarctica.AAC.4